MICRIGSTSSSSGGSNSGFQITPNGTTPNALFAVPTLALALAVTLVEENPSTLANPRETVFDVVTFIVLPLVII